MRMEEFVLVFMLAGIAAMIGGFLYYGPPPSIPDGLVYAKDRYGGCWEVTHEGSRFRPTDCVRAGFAPQGCK